MIYIYIALLEFGVFVGLALDRGKNFYFLNMYMV